MLGNKQEPIHPPNKLGGFLGRGRKSCQNQMAYSNKFPIKMGEGQQVYESLGFRFGNTIDKLFIEAEFPEGWKIKPTDHYMWSELLDNKNRVRGMIFYKPDFWDQDAFVNLHPRYHAEVKKDYDWYNEHKHEYLDKAEPGYIDMKHTAIVRDYDGNILWTSGPTTPRELDQDWRDFDDLLLRVARAELTKLHPNWKDPIAYWD
jgi:hypothetical protein